MNKPNPLQPGSPAPAFSTTDQDGKTHTNQTLLGTRYLLYFYPRDLTPGCTTEACALRDEHEQFTKLNTLVFGISPDGEKSHRKFIDKHSLPFSLLVDEDHAIAEAFGVWGEKKIYGPHLRWGAPDELPDWYRWENRKDLRQSKTSRTCPAGTYRSAGLVSPKT